jgi:hypothetical protein
MEATQARAFGLGRAQRAIDRQAERTAGTSRTGPWQRDERARAAPGRFARRAASAVTFVPQWWHVGDVEAAACQHASNAALRPRRTLRVERIGIAHRRGESHDAATPSNVIVLAGAGLRRAAQSQPVSTWPSSPARDV